MNALVTQTSHLPAHLQHMATSTALTALNQAASAGISSGGWPRISLKSSRFRLLTPQGEEFLVPNLHLDVVIVDANPHGVSKMYFSKKWDPNAEGEAPDCYSDNGVGPSAQAAKPQCGTCSGCPMNVWGSKISEASGKPIKACSDTKKLAVLIADNTGGPVFELRVAADSLKELGAYITALNKHGVPAASVITRLTFDPNASYPRLLFAPAFDTTGKMPYITAEQAADVMEVIGTNEVDVCTGKNDKAIDSAKFVAGTVAAQNIQAQQVNTAPTMAMPPMPPAAAPVAFNPPPRTPAAPAEAPVAPAKTTRTRKAAPPATPPAGGSPSFAPPVQAAFAMPPVQPTTNVVAASAPLVPTGVTNSALDEMLAKAMQA